VNKSLFSIVVVVVVVFNFSVFLFPCSTKFLPEFNFRMGGFFVCVFAGINFCYCEKLSCWGQILAILRKSRSTGIVTFVTKSVNNKMN